MSGYITLASFYKHLFSQAHITKDKNGARGRSIGGEMSMRERRVMSFNEEKKKGAELIPLTKQSM